MLRPINEYLPKNMKAAQLNSFEAILIQITFIVLSKLRKDCFSNLSFMSNR